MTKLCLGCIEQYSDEFTICPHCGYIEGTKAEEAVHMEPGTILENRYTIGKVLGYGGFGVTYIAWDNLLEQKVAIKEYLPSEFSTRLPGEAAVTIFGGDRSEQFTEGLEKFVEEAKRLSKFQNEQGIVKIFDSFRANDTAYIVMEYLDGETLESYLQREGQVSEDKAMEMLLPILNSLQVVHKEGILHRDIAPENIFITKDGDVKLIDFGASRYATTSHSRSLTVIIKPGYSPEEQYRSRGDQGPHTDIYALAATMYKMVTGITPPDALERRALIETKKKDLLKDIHKVNKGVSRNVENAILNAMNVQIEDRTSDIESFVGELNSEAPVKRKYGKIKKIDVYAWPLWLKITASSVFAALAVTGVLLITGVIDFPSLFSDKVVVPEGMVIVPELEGMDKDEAIAELGKLGLKASAEGNVESSYIDAGKIVLQSPAGSSFIKEGGTVSLTVSSGSEVVGPVNGIATVPYVVWDTQENAIAKFKKAGLGEPIIEYKEDANVEVGKVISQSVKENAKTKIGTQVTLVISTGKDGISPNQNDNAIISGNLGNVIQEGEQNAGGTFEYSKEDNEVIITGWKGWGENVTIPEKIERYPVIAIDEQAFEGRTLIKSVKLHAGLRSIGMRAFMGCSSLTSINIPNSVESIGEKAFYGTSIESIDIPSSVTSLGFEAFIYTQLRRVSVDAKEIPGGAFSFCEKLEQVTIGTNVVKIQGAFSFCDSLKSIVIPGNVQEIHGTFGGCKKLSAVRLEEGLKIIGIATFEGCTSLTSINIPNSVQSIGMSAFSGCSSLSSITIPESVKTIESLAFAGCTNLKTVYFTTEVQKQQFAYYFPSDAQLIVQ